MKKAVDQDQNVLEPVSNFSMHTRLQDYHRKYDKTKRLFCKYGLNFTLEYIGKTTEVHFDSGVKRKLGSIRYKKGIFISRMTALNVKKRLAKKLYIPKNIDPNRFSTNTIMYNPDNMRKIFAQPCLAVDINGCYWKTAYNIGVIDEDCYKKGLGKDREYKEARNIAIGGLGAIVVREKYVNGLKVSVERYRRFGALVRLDIIDHVFAMAQRIATKLGPDFLMFLTDCFYIPEHRYNDLCQYIADEGYEHKSQKIEFGGIDRLGTWANTDGEILFTERVVWFDYTSKKRKFHNFSEKHVYDFSGSPEPINTISA